MAERLSALDATLLARDTGRTPMNLATLDIFEAPADGFDYERLLTLIADRIAFVPRYRQRVQAVPGGLAAPVWVDDADFDLTYHVRRSALPRPGSLEQLRDLVARIVSRRLDRNRPLWETYLVEGLAGGRHAVLAKSHLALVDGETVDLAQLIVDRTPNAAPTPDAPWRPEPGGGTLHLLGDAVVEVVKNPLGLLGGIPGRVVGTTAAVGQALRGAASILGAGASEPGGPLTAALSEQRRFATAETPLADYRQIRAEHGGTVNDVVLAVVAGALRAWLMTRAEPVSASSRLRVLVPLGVTSDEDAAPTSLGTRVAPHLLAMPVGEASPVVRLHQVSYALKAHRETGHAVSASRLTEISGFAPTTLHAVGSRVAAAAGPRGYQLLVTNVPGPQQPVYAAGARLLESYPVLPLAPGHALAIGATSYDGRIYYGIDADRDAVPDVEVLAQCLHDSLEELLEASSSTRPRAPRGPLPRSGGGG